MPQTRWFISYGHLFLIVLEVGKSKTKLLAGSVPGQAELHHWQCLFTVTLNSGRCEGTLWYLFYKDTIPFMTCLPPKGPTSKWHHTGDCFQHMNCGRTQTFNLYHLTTSTYIGNYFPSSFSTQGLCPCSSFCLEYSYLHMVDLFLIFQSWIKCHYLKGVFLN